MALRGFYEMVRQALRICEGSKIREAVLYT